MMKRIYMPTCSKWSTEFDRKILVGYEYKGYNIEIEEEATRGMYGNTKKWYHTTFKNGERLCSDRLYEIKEAIDKDIEKEMK